MSGFKLDDIKDKESQIVQNKERRKLLACALIATSGMVLSGLAS